MKRTTPKRYVAFSFLLNRKATSSLSIFRVYSIKYRFHELAFLACLLLIATHIHELNKYISLQIYLNLLTLQNALFPLFSADSLFFPPVQNQNILLSICFKNGILFSDMPTKNRVRKFLIFPSRFFCFSHVLSNFFVRHLRLIF